MKGQSILSCILSCATDFRWYLKIAGCVICLQNFIWHLGEASPDNITTLRKWMEISPCRLFLQTITFSWPYSLGTLPIQTQTQMFWQVLELNQSIARLARPCIELENPPPPIRPTSSATTTNKMPEYNAYMPCIPSLMMQQSQSTAGESHKVVCAHAPEPYGSAMSMNSGFGVLVGSLATSYTPLISPMYTACRPSSLGNPPSLHLHSCISLLPLACYGTSINPLLGRGMTSPIKYDIRSLPSFATSRRHLVNDDRWQYERASNLNLGLSPSAQHSSASPSLCSHRGSTMGSSLCKMCFLPCTTRCELVLWMISIIDKQCCGDKALLSCIVLMKITTWLLDAMDGLDWRRAWRRAMFGFWWQCKLTVSSLVWLYHGKGLVKQ